MSETTSPSTPAAAAAAPADTSAPGRTVLAVVVLIAVSLALFFPSLDYDLVYDDFFLIRNNVAVSAVSDGFANAFDIFAQEYWEGVNPERSEALKARGQALYRPLTVFIWASLYYATDGRYDPVNDEAPAFLFHLVSLLANALTVAMLFLALRSVTGNGRIAFVAALIFAVHPLHTEAAAYVAGLSDVLAALSIFAGLLFFQRATQTPEKVGVAATVMLLLIYFLGMLAKEGAVLLLAVVMLTDYVRTWRGRGLTMNQRLAVYLPMAVVMVAMIAIRYAAVGRLQPDAELIGYLDNPLVQETFVVRLMNGFKLLGMQVWLFLWPAELSVDYSYNVIKVSREFGDPAILASGVLTVVAILFGLIRAKSHPALAWGLLFFFGCAIFTSNILVPIGTIFGERLTYLPSAGAALCVAAIIDRAIASRRTGSVTPVGAVLLLIIVGSLGARTWERQKDFETTWTLFESALEVVPESARVHYQLGSLYTGDKLYSKAEEHYLKALNIDATFLQAGLGLANVYRFDKQYERAIAQYDTILRGLAGKNPDQVDELRRLVLSNRAQAQLGMGDTTGALSALREATNLMGDSSQAFADLARLLVAEERFEEAIVEARRGLAIAPNDVELTKVLGNAALMVGDEVTFRETVQTLENTEGGRAIGLAMQAELLYDEGELEGDPAKVRSALQMFDEAKQLDPELASPYIYRGRFFAQEGRFFDAIVDLDRALQKSPDNPAALDYKARAQVGAGRPDEAIETLERLVTVRPSVGAYRQLALLYAQSGMVDEMEATYETLEGLGESAAEIIYERAIAYVDQGQLDQAILTLEQGLALPDYVNNPLLTRSLAICYLDATRYEEALATFDLQADIAAASTDSSDPYIPLNKARCLMGLGRDLEAAAQLEMFEQAIDPESNAYVSLLHRRAQLFLRRDGPMFQPAAAAELAEQAIDRTKRRYPPYFLVAIEAHAASGDVLTAQLLGQEAKILFPSLPTFDTLTTALNAAAGGDVSSASDTLRATGDADLLKIADALGG